MRLSFLLLFIPASLLNAQEFLTWPEHPARERTYHVVHYKLNIDIDERAKSCDGSVTITLVPLRPQLDVVKFDAAEMEIRRVTLKSSSMDFTVAGETLLIHLDKPYGIGDTLSFLISYSVTAPRKGLYFVQPDSGYPAKIWTVWSQGEPEENHFWFPCYDFPNDKATSEMVATVNDKWTVISNGKLVDVKKDPVQHRATFYWLENRPHSSYLISIVAGEYVKVGDAWRSTPVDNYVYTSEKNLAMQSFSKTPKMIEFFSTKIGYDYPWEKYAQTVVQDFIYGGEENTSATTLTDVTIHDARAHLDYSSDGLVAHELAHQWWGDLLTCRDWSHAWLNEGFASYFDILFQEFDQSVDVAAKSILDSQTGLLVTDAGDKRRPTVCARYNSPIDLFDNRIYGKGACVLHMLRFVLGDELFWKSMNHYAHKFAYRNVETNDLKIAVEEATGYNLNWFFDEWLYRAGYPDLVVRSAWDRESRSVKVSVRQVQKIDSLTRVFTMPVDIEVWVNDLPETYRVMIAHDSEEFSFPAYREPQLVIFDKGNVLLKRVQFEKPTDQWMYQLRYAAAGIDRYLAADELHWIPDSPGVRSALSSALFQDRFWEVRREATFALGASKVPAVADTLIGAYGDRDARVRAAVVAVLRNFHGEQVLTTLRHAFAQDSSYAVAAGALFSLTVVDSANARAYCEEGLHRDSYREVIRSSAIRALAGMEDDTTVATIKQYTEYGVDRNLRIDCLWTLSRARKKDDRVLDYFISLLHDPSFHVRQTVIAILGTLGNPRALEPLQKSMQVEADSRLVKSVRDAVTRIQNLQSSPH
jgi:aminopeptidase N